MFRITRGLDLPIAGAPVQRVAETKLPASLGLVGSDYLGLKPSLLVAEGEHVERGQALIADRSREGVLFTAPMPGTITAITRGDRRAFISLELALDTDRTDTGRTDAGSTQERTFTTFSQAQLASATRTGVAANLLASGLWTALRTRPFDKIPSPASAPHSIFVNAMDTNPLAADVDVVCAGREDAFAHGVLVLSRLTDGAVYVCRSPRSKAARVSGIDRVSEQEFDGPHPAGLVGTHIHFLDPVGPNKTVWHLNYQDVLAIGELFATGRLDPWRVIALAGPQVTAPRLLRSCLGASIEDLTRGELAQGENRAVSGSALHGAECGVHTAYLGRYATQVTVLREGRERKLLGYLQPGTDLHSVSNMVAGAFRRGARHAFTTSTNGSARAMVPIGSYEAVMPLDIHPTYLLRYLIVGDTERAAQLGALELGEEDLALCTYVCPGKYEYGPILRDVLTRIEVEG